MGIFGSKDKKAMAVYQIGRDSSTNAVSEWNPPADWDFVGVAGGAFGNSVSLWFKGRIDGTLRVVTGFFPKDGEDEGKLILAGRIGELRQAGS